MLWIELVYDHVSELLRVNSIKVNSRLGLEVTAMDAMILFNTAERVERGEASEREFRRRLGSS